MNTRALKILLTLSIMISGCSESSKSARTQQSPYPRIVDSLQINDRYDSTKWYLYTYYCMDTPGTYYGNIRTQTIVSRPYSSLELHFDSLRLNGDSCAFYFSFNNDIDGKLINHFNYDEWSGMINGLMFTADQPDTLMYFVRSNSSMPLESLSFPKWIYDTTSYKKVKPLQPDIIRFINKNKNMLNPWFLEQAKKRGIITD
jgi:hypothetical protein